jgi:hypothetical protein
MPSAAPRVVPILCAERGNGTRPTEDRIFTTDRAVIVLDGASQPDPTPLDGGWLAEQLGRTLAQRLTATPDVELAQVLEDSIRHVADRHQLRPGESPSTTVAIVRWNAHTVEALVLCDSTVVTLDKLGCIHEVRDDRLATASRTLRRTARVLSEDIEGWRTFVAGQRRARNRVGGYWVAEAVPEAARHAMTASWPIDELAIVMAMTDGVSKGVDCYRVPPNWPSAIELAADDPSRLVEAVHAAEEGDPTGQRWPRSKRHDDKALAVVRFDLANPGPG